MADKPTTKSADSSADAGQAEVQAKFDEANKKGYFGTLPEGRDSNESYTLAAVTKNAK